VITALEPKQVVQRVVERAQVRVDLLREIAGQEAEALAGFHGWARQHDALDGVALERIDRARDRQIRLAGAGRADAQRQVVRQDAAQVFALHRRAAMQIGAPRMQHRRQVVAVGHVEARFRHVGAMRGHLPGLHQAELDIVHRQRLACAVVERFQRVGRALRVGAADGELAAAPADGHVQRLFDLAQVLVQRPAQVLQARVVVLGRNEFSGVRFHQIEEACR
jgi:hypothetical protein